MKQQAKSGTFTNLDLSKRVLLKELASNLAASSQKINTTTSEPFAMRAPASSTTSKHLPITHALATKTIHNVKTSKRICSAETCWR